MVYDVTDPINGPHVPLTRPHAELNPFQPSDRILFGAPIASVAFVQHDWPLTGGATTRRRTTGTGTVHGGDGAPLQPELQHCRNGEQALAERRRRAGAVLGPRRVLPEQQDLGVNLDAAPGRSGFAESSRSRRSRTGT